MFSMSMKSMHFWIFIGLLGVLDSQRGPVDYSVESVRPRAWSRDQMPSGKEDSMLWGHNQHLIQVYDLVNVSFGHEKYMMQKYRCFNMDHRTTTRLKSNSKSEMIQNLFPFWLCLLLFHCWNVFHPLKLRFILCKIQVIIHMPYGSCEK